jgi:hypothetical protein
MTLNGVEIKHGCLCDTWCDNLRTSILVAGIGSLFNPVEMSLCTLECEQCRQLNH